MGGPFDSDSITYHRNSIVTRKCIPLAAIVLTSLPVLNGCGSMTASLVGIPPRYEDTDNASKARLRTIYDMFDQIYLSPGGICSKFSERKRAISKPIAKGGVNIVSGNSVTFEEKLLGMPLQPFPLEPNRSLVFSEFYIPAGREIRISYASQARGPGGLYCRERSFAFTAKPGRDYEAEIVMSKDSCLYVMAEITEQGRVPVTENFRAITDDDCKK